MTSSDHVIEILVIGIISLLIMCRIRQVLVVLTAAWY